MPATPAFTLRAFALVAGVVLGSGCSPREASPDASSEARSTSKRKAAPSEASPEAVIPARFHGTWRFVLDSPGGRLPFLVEIDAKGGALVDEHERFAFDAVEVRDQQIRLELAHYDSVLEGRWSVDAREEAQIVGTWRRRAPGPGGLTQMSFHAEPNAHERFVVEHEQLRPLSGRWSLTFSEDDGSTYAGLAELQTRHGPGAEPWVEGTILTDTGDYRYLEGALVEDQLQLAVFDGAHAFSFRAKLDEGELVDGHFWSRDSYHATFAGTPVEAGASTGLADPFEIVELTASDGRFHFDFHQLGGGSLTQDDPRFVGKVVLVELFGTWCPNCNDQAPLMSEWYAEYHGRGLEMVGIAFEFSGDEQSDMDMVQRYARRYDVDYPLLLGGTSDKKSAALRVPDLSEVAAYPTTIFIGRDGKVRRVYSGFSGPATGEAFEVLKTEFREEIEGLLAESP